MLIALTGANGFLGRYTAVARRGAGHRVRALVPSDGPTQGEPTADEWQVGDQYDPQAQIELVAGVFGAPLGVVAAFGVCFPRFDHESPRGRAPPAPLRFLPR